MNNKPNNTVKSKNNNYSCKCNQYGINLTTFNILAPELLLSFWNQSYKLGILSDENVDILLGQKKNNVLDFIKKQNSDIFCLQEVSVPVDNTEEYQDVSREFYLPFIEKYEINNLKIANFAFKKNPLYYDYPSHKVDSFKDKRFITDTGVLTLYNPTLLQHLASLNSEDFPEDLSEYQIMVNPPKNYNIKSKKINKLNNKNTQKIQKYIENPKCTFSKKSRCKNKAIPKGSPFTLDKFKIIETGDIFYVINTHIIMNYPRIDNLKNVVNRISYAKKTYPDFYKFKWTNTIMAGDFNGDTVEGNTGVKKYTLRTRMKNVFRGYNADRVLCGTKIHLKKRIKGDIPIIKTQYEIKNNEDILNNQQIVENGTLISDHQPYYIYFFIN